MFKIIKKADIVLFFILILFGLTLTWLSLRGSSAGTKVLIRVDGEDYGTYSLMENQEITITQGEQVNIVEIQNGKVFMHSSTCSNQICVDHAPIDETNESIVCLPNRVSVEIQGGKESDIDVIS